MTTTVTTTVVASTAYVEVDSMKYSEWWMPCGCLAAHVIAAYKAKGAASQAASYVNLANPGTYDLQPTGVYWDSSIGWYDNTGGFTQLYGGPLNDDTQGTVAVRFSGVNTSGSTIYVMAQRRPLKLTPYKSATNSVGYGYSTSYAVAPAMASGILAMTSKDNPADGDSICQGYRNGVPDGDEFRDSAWITGEDILFFVNQDVYMEIQAAVFYNKVLSPVQIKELSDAMAAL